MARGYPDFFGQLIVPKYGTAYTQAQLALTVGAAGNEDIFSLAYKGRIYGGYFELTRPVGETFATIRVLIDGQTICQLAPENFINRGLVSPAVSALFAVFISPVIARYVFALTPDMVFEQTFVVNVANGDPLNDIGVVGNLLYTFIM